MSTSCTVILKEEKEVISVPIDSVSENSDGKQYVTKVNEDGETEEVIVETGIADENYVQILSGLALNDKIQIETEITESTNNSNNNQGMFGNFGGQMGGEQKGFRQNGEMSNVGGEPPADRGQMKQSGQSQQSFNK